MPRNLLVFVGEKNNKETDVRFKHEPLESVQANISPILSLIIMLSVFCENYCKLYSDKADGKSTIVVHKIEGQEHQDRHLHLRLQVETAEIFKDTVS